MENKGKGWHEDADPTCRNKKGKLVARRHSEVVQKEKLKDTMRAPMRKDKSFDENEPVEKIIEEVQNGRKPDAVAKDNTKTAKKVGSKEDTEDIVKWIREPEESDLEGVDIKSDKPDKEAEEE